MRASNDHQHCHAIAKRLMEWPDDFSSSDGRWYVTHAPVCTMTRDADLLSVSNYHTALNMLRGAVAHDESGASEARGDDVVTTSMGHWGFGYIDVIMVRVYVSDDWANQPEDAREFTPAFLEAVDIKAALESYPVLDESDYSERERDAWQEVFADAFDHAARSFPDDTPAEDEAMWRLMTDRLSVDGVEAVSPDGYSPDALDWDRVTALYRELRSEHFAAYGAAILAAIQAPPPGQSPLPGL